MESAPSIGSEKTDMHEGLDAPAEEERAQPRIRDQRQLIAKDYELTALSRRNIYGRVNGAATTHFHRITEELGAAIVEELDSHPHTIEEIRELYPDIKLLARIKAEMNKDREFQSGDLAP